MYALYSSYLYRSSESASLAVCSCPCRKSDPDVTMVQSAEDRQRQNAPYRLDRPRQR